MKAHQLDSNNIIINTLIVDSLDEMPGLVDGSNGGEIGDQYVNGSFIKNPETARKKNAELDEQINAIEMGQGTALREYVLGRDLNALPAIQAAIDALKAQKV